MGDQSRPIPCLMVGFENTCMPQCPLTQDTPSLLQHPQCAGWGMGESQAELGPPHTNLLTMRALTCTVEIWTGGAPVGVAGRGAMVL